MNNFIFWCCIVVMVAGYIQFGVTMYCLVEQERMNPGLKAILDYKRGYTITYQPFSLLFFLAVLGTIWIASGAQV